MRITVALILALLISGCASRTEDRRLSIKDTPARSAAEPGPKQSSKCGDRHLDHQAGRSPEERQRLRKSKPMIVYAGRSIATPAT
jgi:PBP1b-binding outer membrane lipoprotein LpoB